jgi:hypothetical protein
MAYANSYSKEYYLNSVASPTSIQLEMDFKGLSTEIMFFKDKKNQD